MPADIQGQMATPTPAIGGRLDGLTILRFARAYESGGGLEGHLADLNRALATRNRIATIQLQLTDDPERLAPVERCLGRSRLLTVPLLVLARIQTDTRSAWLTQAKHRALDALLSTPRLNSLAMRQLSRWRAVPRKVGEADDAGTTAAELIQRFKVDLVVLHACGGADVSDIIEAAESTRVPLAIVHHFSNDRLGDVSARQQVSRVDGVAGASWVGVPSYLRTSFSNLSDAVDTAFYSRERARAVPTDVRGPVLYAPGRLTPEKGQTDVIEVAFKLRQRGLNPMVLFAGRADSPEFQAHLHRLVAERRLSDCVRFLGSLSLEEYRDWYCAAQVMVMPTRHSEGMPRTLIESQAMKVPPVVYDIGGTREGVRHRETGFVTTYGDVEEMTRAVERLLREPDLQRSMAEAGRRFVDRTFSLQMLAERHEDFYARVLARAGAQPSAIGPS